MRTYKQVVKELLDVKKDLLDAKETIKRQNLLMIDRVQELQKLNAEERKLTNFNRKIQLENIQLASQRDAVITALADCQRRNATGMPFTDRAAEVL